MGISKGRRRGRGEPRTVMGKKMTCVPLLLSGQAKSTWLIIFESVFDLATFASALLLLLCVSCVSCYK